MNRLNEIEDGIKRLSRELMTEPGPGHFAAISVLGLMGELVTEIKRIESANIKAFEDLSGNRNL